MERSTPAREPESPAPTQSGLTSSTKRARSRGLRWERSSRRASSGRSTSAGARSRDFWATCRFGARERTMRGEAPEFGKLALTLDG